jgi:hypothetical protein
MWISLDELDAALVNLCEFKVLILLRCFVHKRYHSLDPFTRSFYKAINDIKMISKYCEGNNNRRQYTQRHGGAVLIANVKQVNSFQAVAPLTGPEKGVLFKGAYLPQKWDILPPY